MDLDRAVAAETLLLFEAQAIVSGHLSIASDQSQKHLQELGLRRCGR